MFDDLLRYLPQTADKLQVLRAVARPRLAKATPRSAVANLPAVRMNALPVASRPPLCRLVDCNIGGYKEIAEAITAAGVDIIAQRTQHGVLAFGRDKDIRKAFESFGIKAFDNHPLAAKRLVKEAGERALLRDALFRGLRHRPGLHLQRRGRTTYLLPDPATASLGLFNTDKTKPVDRFSGTVPKTLVPWSEACALRVDYRLDQLWLLIEPTIIADKPADPEAEIEDLVREFVRERQVRRHNRAANAMLDGWISLIFGRDASVRLKAFGIGDGVDAEFEVLRTSGFSGAGQR